MRDDSRLAVLASPAFILALLALLANDFLLKGLLHDWFSGKLSDFAGLFVFASLWLILLPGRPRTVLIGVASFFIWWKSPLSQLFIDIWNAHLPAHVHRVVDYSDLLALTVLPPARSNFRHWQGRRPSRFIIYPMACLAFLGTMATSMAIPTVKGDLRVDPTVSAGNDDAQRLYAAVDAYAQNRGMMLKPAPETMGTRRAYWGAQQTLNVNFDAEGHRLFYSIGSTGSRTELAKLNEQFAEEIHAIDPGVEIEQGDPADTHGSDVITQFGMYFPAHHFVLTCSGDTGTDNPDMRTALAVIDSFASEHHLAIYTPGPYGPTASCLTGVNKYYLGGRVTGTTEWNYSLRLEVFAWFGLRGTTMQVNMRACCDMYPAIYGISEDLHQRLAAQAWQDPEVSLDSLSEWPKPPAPAVTSP